jgi:rod shape-determining protein MreD
VTRAQAVWVIYVSLAGALLFTLLPLPMDWRGLRPDVAALALFYWVLALPHRVGVATAFTVGVAQDLIEGAPLGLSSPGLMLATLLLLFNYQRIRQFDLLQQSLAILVLMLLSAGIEQWLRNGIAVPAVPWAGVAGIICSVLCWVPIRTVLRHSRRYYEVY